MPNYVEIHSPNERFTGTVAGVVFRNGVGRVDAEARARLEYFERQGYRIGETTGRPPFEEWEPGRTDHSVPPGSRLQDALDPDDAAQPNIRPTSSN